MDLWVRCSKDRGDGGNIGTSKRLCRRSIISGVVYLIRKDCRKVYIGQTGPLIEMSKTA